MIEIEGNRLYWNGVKQCYVEHKVPVPFSGHCYVSYSHRHGRNLISCAGKAWLGDDDGSLPRPDIVIGHVIGPNGLLPDSGSMEHLVALLEARDDDGLNTTVKVA
jgi:hypothetical protein